MRVSAWLQDPDAAHCCMRIIEGGDPHRVADRVAFIEKTPRVRVAPYTDEDSDFHNWQSGPKGSGGGDPARDLTYGYDPQSRAWCDARLREMGYTLDQRHLVGRSMGARRRAARREAAEKMGHLLAWVALWDNAPEYIAARARYRVGKRLRPCLGCRGCLPPCPRCDSHNPEAECDCYRYRETPCGGSAVQPARRTWR